MRRKLTPSLLDKTLYEAYMDEVKLKDTILETGVENMSLVPSNSRLANVQLQLSAEYCREFFLAEILQSGDGFDFIPLPFFYLEITISVWTRYLFQMTIIWI